MSATETSVLEEVKLAHPVLWTVVLHNDDYTPMDFVVEVLTDVFHLSEPEAEVVMMTVHAEGKAPVGSFTKEIANTKAKLVCRLAEEFDHPLLATAEPT